MGLSPLCTFDCHVHAKANATANVKCEHTFNIELYGNSSVNDVAFAQCDPLHVWSAVTSLKVWSHQPIPHNSDVVIGYEVH